MDLNFSTVDRFLSGVNLDVPNPGIDLGSVTFFDPFALVYLGMYLRYWSSNGKSFTVTLPRARPPREYLARVQFWERFNFDEETVRQENKIRSVSDTSFNDIIDVEKTDSIAEEISLQLLNVLRNTDASVNKLLIAELAGELVDNFAAHSGRMLAACVMQYYPNIRRVDFAIGDCGVGIRSSLASNPRYAYLADRHHSEAALKAFDPLVSRRAEGGTGLTSVSEGLQGENGTLVLATGNGYVRIVTGRVETGPMRLDLPGVQIQMSFPEKR